MSSVSSAALATGSTRDQILGAARELIATRSYLGFSFQDVADAVGVRKASLYHHFPSKEALGVAVLRDAIQGFRRRDEAKARTPRESLDAYFRMYRNGLRAGSAVCPAGALAPGWDCINDELRRTVQERGPRGAGGRCVRGLPGRADRGAHDRPRGGFRRRGRATEEFAARLTPRHPPEGTPRVPLF